MIKRAPTLKDVAELAGVSKMAVSVVVTGKKSTVGVSESTRARIVKALEELQYQPNAFAKSLRLKRTGTIGVYHGSGYINTRDPYIREILQGVAEGLSVHEQDLLLYTGFYSHRRESAVNRVLNNKIDAVIVLPSHDDSSLIESLKEGWAPSVVIAEAITGLTSITAADADGSRMIAEHLLSKGHRHILYRRSAGVSERERLRFEAFQTTIESSGGQVVSSRAVEPMDSINDVEEQLIRDKSSADRITAVACWRDYSAVRLLNFCAMSGIRVPHDLAVVGFDGVTHASMPLGTNLTTVVANWRQIARTATDLVTSKLNESTDVPQVTIVPATLNIGNTV